MSNDDDPFIFRNWRDEIYAVPTIDGPFASASIEADLNGKLHHDQNASLVLPDLETFAYGHLEDIAPEAFSSSDIDDHANPSTDEDLWSLPDSLTIDHAPKLRTWTAFLHPDHVPPPPSLLSESNPAVFDALLSEFPSDPHLTLDTPFIISCLSLAAQGHASPLFSRTPGSTTFQPFDDGAFRAFGLSAAATQSLVRTCTAIGEAVLGLQDFVERTHRARESAKARVALATCVRELLELDRRRVRERIGKVRGVVALQEVFGVSEELVGMLLRLRDVCLRAVTDEDAVLMVHEEIGRLIREFSPLTKTLEAVDVAITRPVVQRLTCNLGLRAKSATDYFDEEALDESMLDALLDEQDRSLVTEISQGLDMLRTGDPSHPLVQGVGQSVFTSLFTDDISTIDPDRALALAKEYEETVKAALNDTQPMQIVMPDADHQAISASESSLDDTIEAFKTAFVDLGAQFIAQPTVQDAEGHDCLHTAFSHDIQSYADPLPSTIDLPSTSQTILSPIRPILRCQATLLSTALHDQIFLTSNLTSHLSLLNDHVLFSSGSFIHHLQTSLFSTSLSSSTHSTLFGLRLSAPAPTWPPTSSALRLALAGILPPGKELSFSIRNLSDREIDQVLDPCSSHALDFLKLSYTPPQGLAWFFTEEVLGKYDMVSRFLLGLVRQMYIVTHLSDLKGDKGEAHLFAFEARSAVAAIAAGVFDLGIAPLWTEFVSGLEGRGMGVKEMLRRHEETLDAIRTRLLLSTRWRDAHSAREEVFGAVLRGARAVMDSDPLGVGVARRELRAAKEGMLLALRRGIGKGRGREEVQCLEVLVGMLE